MKSKLIKLLEKSYSPYSKVRVAAIVIDDKNNEYNGVNIENATFTPTVCAERCAIFNFITHKQNNIIKEIHLISSIGYHLFPCGVCRQVMSEFFDHNVKIFIYSLNDEKIITTNIEKLIPNKVQRNFF